MAKISLMGIRLRLSFIFLVFLGASKPADVLAFERDTHYYLRFSLSLATCFNWEESHIIASADWGMDENQTTFAEKNPLKTNNKVKWHAFGHSDQRFRELWIRSVAETNLESKLIKLGQFLHFLEDWESHAGYGIRLGHARDTYTGRDPDSLGASLPKTHRMLQSALDHLLAACDRLGRLGDNVDRDRELIWLMKEISEDGMMESLFEVSNPNWKWGKAGMLRRSGQKIIRVNKERVETFIAKHVQHLEDKGIPESFEPGNINGIPSSLRIPFDSNGGVLKSFKGVSGMVAEFDGNQGIANLQLSLEDAQPVFRTSNDIENLGWILEVTASNIGDRRSDEGDIEILVIDSDQETITATLIEQLGTLEPGEVRDLELFVSSDVKPESDVIIVGSIRSDDFSAMNNEDWLMLGNAENLKPVRAIINELDPLPALPESIRILGQPKFLIVAGEACVVVSALAAGGDSTEKLKSVMFEFVDAEDDGIPFEQATTSRWSALSTKEGLIAGKTFYCSVPDDATFDALSNQAKNDSLRLIVSIEGARGMIYSDAFVLEKKFIMELIELAGVEAKD